MKFAMGADTLGVLSKATSGSSDDLSLLVRQLFEAAEPLEGRLLLYDGLKGQARRSTGSRAAPTRSRPS